MFFEQGNANAALILYCKETTQNWKIAEKNLDLKGFTWSLILLTVMPRNEITLSV